MAELEKEKMMRDLELKEIISQHRGEIRNMEIQLSTLKVIEGRIREHGETILRSR